MGSITVVVCLVGLQIGQAQWADHHHAHNDHDGADHAESSRGDHKDHDQHDGHVTKEEDRHDDVHGKGSNEKVEEVVVEDYHDNGHHSRRINDHPSHKVYSPLPYGYGYNFHGARHGYADSGHYGYPHYGYEPYGSSRAQIRWRKLRLFAQIWGRKLRTGKSTCMHMTLVTWSNMCPCMSRISASFTGRTGT